MISIQRRNHSFVLFGLWSFVFLISFPAEKSEGQVTGIGHFADGERFSFANDVSGDGMTVVGGARDSNGINRSARWTLADGLENIDGGTDEDSGGADAVSYDGSFVAGEFMGETGRWSPQSGFTQIGDGGNSLTGISGNGDIIVGWDGTPNAESAIRWSESSGLLELGNLDVNPGSGFSYANGVSSDGSVIVGRSTTDSLDGGPRVGFRWTEEDGMSSLGAFEPGFSSEAHAVSGDGSVIVGHGLVRIFGGGFGVEAFRWDVDTGMVGLGFLSGTNGPTSIASAISGDGNTIGGFAVNPNQGGDAMIWTEETGMVSLYDLLVLQGHDVSGWDSLSRVTGISWDGSIAVGQGVNANGENEGFVARIKPSSIPEPSSASLLLACITVASVMRRRTAIGKQL